MKLRLSAVQRFVLLVLFNEAKHGRPLTPIVSGYKTTRVGFSSALDRQVVATNSTTLFMLRHHGLIEGADIVKDVVHYRLTAKGEGLLGQRKPTGVVLTPKQWERRAHG